MNNRPILILISLLFTLQIYCQSDKERIGTLIDEWHLAAAQADYNTYFSLMNPNSVFIGTDASENWQLEAFKQFSKPYFDKGKAWNFIARERQVYLAPEGQFAWFDELLETWMGICRGSGVLLKDRGNWKIAHYVLSATIPNGDMRQVIEIKREKDSLYLLELKMKDGLPEKE